MTPVIARAGARPRLRDVSWLWGESNTRARPGPPWLLPPDDVAELIGVSAQTVRRLALIWENALPKPGCVRANDR
jgi:hypothetical protein